MAQWHKKPHDPVAACPSARQSCSCSLGDIKALGDSLYEMREYFGPGWRMYYVKRGDVLIVILGGGSKSTQRSDIAVARQRALLLED